MSQSTNTYIDIHRLRRLYKKIGIRYLKPQRVFLLTDERKEELKEERIDYALRLAALIRDKANIIYVDETTFNSTLRV